MKKLFLTLAVALGIAMGANAVPAHPGMQQVKQPDGTSLTLRLVGDEFMHYYTTSDGYTIVKNNGRYEYAKSDNGQLVASGIMAHDQAQRTQTDIALLRTLNKHLTAAADVNKATTLRAQRDQALAPQRASAWSNYKGLVILVNCQDRSFQRSDAQAFYQNMTNQVNYSGYTDASSGNWVSYTGSVRDYFRDNSMGMFDPQFDVVGPVTVDYNSTSFSSTNNAYTIFKNALSKANSLVNFSNYDANGDGYVDMVYFIVAGYGANFSGNSSSYLWPHASSFYYTSYDGKYIGRYACSVELYGYESEPSTVTIDGVGTMCHEFSHVLGVMDHYDTDYSSSGGESQHPGEWDIMAGGSYHNYSRTPAGYTLFERYTMGFANPQVITNDGTYTLNPLNTSNEGYIIKTPVNKEYFILDNRQKTRWDTYIPGHGMTIWRVDSTSTSVWSNNNVNVNPNHNYLVLLRAGNVTTGDGHASDPFPGTKNVRMVSDQTTPSLKSWAGYASGYALTGITETNGVITFTVGDTGELKSEVEDFEAMPTTDATSSTDVQGVYATWNFTKSRVTAPDTANCNGSHSAAVISPCALTMTSDIDCESYKVSVHVYNPTSTKAGYKLYYSTDQGSTWTEVYSNALEVAATTDEVIEWQFDMSGPVRYRLNMVSGSKSVNAYVDDFTIHYTGDFTIVENEALLGDVNGDGVVDVTDVNIFITKVLGGTVTTFIEANADLNGDGIYDVTDINMIISIILGN